MYDPNMIQTIAIIALPMLFAITVHEVAHGWVANRLGDPTARMLGRLTLNPIKHIDPLGTILVPLTMFILSGAVFGWAKPVPITVRNLKGGSRDMALVAVAGPASNLIMALIWSAVASIVLHTASADSSIATPLLHMARYGILINLVLMVLNLLPILPLDGGRILEALLPGPMAWKFSRLEPYGMIIILGLIFLGGWERIILPVISFLTPLILALFGVGR